MAHEFKKICDMLKAAKTLLLVTHVNPEGPRGAVTNLPGPEGWNEAVLGLIGD